MKHLLKLVVSSAAVVVLSGCGKTVKAPTLPLKPSSFTAKKEEIKFTYATHNRDITVLDRKYDTSTAMGCSAQYYNLLAKGDVDGAAELTSNPNKTKKQWNKIAKGNVEKRFVKKMRERQTASNSLPMTFKT